jgi:iron(III) transport system ATP-binding protein
MSQQSDTAPIERLINVLDESMVMKKGLLEAQNISLSYGQNAVLRDVSFRIEPGEFFALLGPSGSGKSTLLRLIAGFNRNQGGRLLIDGRDVSGLAPQSRQVGMVFQNYALWPHMTVFDNVAFGLVERKVPKADIRKRVAAVLDVVGLADFADRRPNQLSGGQQQRVALARTIVIEPAILLLDEPLSNLDKNLRVQMRDELKKLQRTLGITTIFVTHDQEEAMTTADRMAVLNHGVLQQVGRSIDLYDYPVNSFVAGFVGTANLIDGQVSQQGDQTLFQGAGLSMALPHRPNDDVRSGSVQLFFRPHSVRLAGSQYNEVNITWVPGRVASSEFSGEFTRYSVNIRQTSITVDQPHLIGAQDFAVGDSVFVGIDLSQTAIL